MPVEATNDPTTDHLDVNGARLYYEVRGSGPVLLVIGQPMTSGPFAPLADLLAEHYTVVTYDPRGLGASAVDDPSLPVSPEVEADDLARLVDAVGSGPVDVFASSGGAVAGLALAARHPAKVRILVAHEPPVAELVPDAAYVAAVVDGIEQAYRGSGSGEAWGRFVSLVVHQGQVGEAGVPMAAWPPAPGADSSQNQAATEADDSGQSQAPPPQSEKQAADDALFFLRMLKPFTRYVPEVDLLRAGEPRVVIGVGETSHDELAVRSAQALAARLGTTPVPFPGDHGGFMGDPAAFAATLRRVLSEAV